ncbi:MAG TPA: hypothetical protein VHE61_00145 [Opitutaceae bacterium]|nr:hypothetical protein [Opitutaceae bacterium]
MGQAKKKRHCPAVARDISAAECGENRQSRYACPESCPFNPFSAANYEQQLEIEDRLDAIMLPATAADHGDPIALASRFETAARANPAHGQHAAVVNHLFIARDASGRTFAERWLAGGMQRERNDLQVFLRGKMQMRVVLLEIRQIVNDREFLAVDLLSPGSEPLRFVDRSLAAVAARFATLLTWAFPMPHFWRTSGAAVDLSDVVPLPAADVLDTCVRHLHGPEEPDARRRWLADNFARIDDVLHATGRARRRDMLAAMDASFGSATYDVRVTPAQCHAALAAADDVDRDELAPAEAAKGFQSAYVWFDRARRDGVPLPGRRVLGRILVGAKELSVEALGGARLDDLRQKLEDRLGSRVTFSRERRDDIAGQMLAREPEFDPALVPPRLLENPSRFDMASSRLPAPPPGVELKDYEAATRTEMQRQLLDEPVPALGGCTPREAAAIPARRAELVEWAKGLVRLHDRNNLRGGRTDDINEFIRSLGLSELDVPPPPLRPIPEVEDGSEGDDDDFDDNDDFDDDEDFDDDDVIELPASPGAKANPGAAPLSHEPLTFDQAIERLQKGHEAFDTAAAAIDALTEVAPSLIDDLAEICESKMGDDEFTSLVVFVVQIWFALVPRGAAPALDFDAVREGVDRRWKLLDRSHAPSVAVIEKLMSDSPQPDLVAVVSAKLLETTTKGPRAMRLSPKAATHALIVLVTFIAELDRALRE